MILGMGHDLVDIRRIEGVIERRGEAFLARVFTDAERALADSRPGHRTATYARRFAAKEALLKALGTGLRGGIQWTDMEILPDDSGKPVVTLRGAAAKAAGNARIHVSMSDEPPYASAWVILESHG